MLHYPKQLRDARIEGSVIVAMVIGPDGSVADAQPMAASHPDFVPPALQVVRGSHYTPPMLGGKPVWTFVCQPVTFSIAYSR